MLTRVTGLAALGAGLVLVIGVFNVAMEDLNAVRVAVVYVLGLLGLVGIHLRQVGARPGLAWLGFVGGLVGWGTGAASMVLSTAGLLPASGGEFGFFSAIALWIGMVILGATMLAIGVFPLPVGLALTVAAPIAMIGLLGGQGGAEGDALNIVSQAGIVLFGLAWLGIGLSLLTARSREGVLRQSTS